MFVLPVAFPVVASAEEPPGECCTDEEDGDADPEGYVGHEVVDVSNFVKMSVHGIGGGVVGKLCCLTDGVVYFEVIGDDLGVHRGGVIEVQESGEVGGEDEMSVDVDDVSAGGIHGELEGLIAVVGLTVPGDFFVVDVGSPDGDFHAVDGAGFYPLHVSDEYDVFFAVLFSVGFDPSYFECVDVLVDGRDAHASSVDVSVGEVRGMRVDPVPFTDFLGVVNHTEDVTVIVIDCIMDQGVAVLFLVFGDVDDFGGEEVFFDGGSVGEEPLDDEGDASLVYSFEEQAIAFPVVDRPGVFPAVVFREFGFRDDLLGDEVQVGNSSEDE